LPSPRRNIHFTEAGNDGSWIDFHISFGGFSGEIEDIRQTHYKAPQGDLCFRPYEIVDNGPKSFDLLIKGAKILKANYDPEIKILRQVLSGGEGEALKFIADMNSKGKSISDKFKDLYMFHMNLWNNKKTPFFDMIEILEFYPGFEF
jgi:hypothetical protein